MLNRVEDVSPFLRLGNVLLEVPGEFTTLTAPVGLRIDGQSLSVAPTTFFRSARLPSAAESLSVAPGEDLIGIDIVCIRQATVRVAGTLSASRRSTAGIAVRLVPGGVDDGLSEVPLDAARTVTDSVGRFVFAGVPAGEYVISSELGVLEALDSGAPELEFLRYPLSVGSFDVEGLVLNLQAALSITGRLEFPKDDTAVGARVSLRAIKQRRIGIPITERSTSVDASGKFRLDRLLPGPYSLSLGLPGGRQIQDIFLDGREHRGGPVRLTADSDVRVLVARSLPTLTVALSPPASALDSDLTAVVFPSPIETWSYAWFDTRRVRAEPLDENAAAHFRNLPVGEYFAMVLPMERLAANWRTPERLRILAASAQRVQMQSSTTVTVTLARGTR
jgi:hypothetical protein